MPADLRGPADDFQLFICFQHRSFRPVERSFGFQNTEKCETFGFQPTWKAGRHICKTAVALQLCKDCWLGSKMQVPTQTSDPRREFTNARIYSGLDAILVYVICKYQADRHVHCAYRGSTERHSSGPLRL